MSNIKISSVNLAERQQIDIHPGDTVRVWVKIQEKDKTRLQAFEGIVLARKHGNEPGATFTVRRVLGGVGVEKIFPLYSPVIDKIEIVKRVKTRRAKLYHIREKAAREIKRQMRKMKLVSIATTSGTEEKAKSEEEKQKEEAEKADTTTEQKPETAEEPKKEKELKDIKTPDKESNEKSDEKKEEDKKE